MPFLKNEAASCPLSLPSASFEKLATSQREVIAKYVDHGRAEVFQRMALMYGFAPGDKRVGIILKR